MARALGAAFCLLVASQGLAATAHADAVANKLGELGLLGRWARDCGQPLSSANPHVFFERTAAGARYRYVSSATAQTVRSVDAVEPQSDGTILMRVTNISGDEPGFRIEFKMAKEVNRYRVYWSKGSDGKVYVDNGVIVATGAQNYWQNYCGSATGPS